MDIAAEFTDKTFVRDRAGNNQPLRIFAIEQSSTDWILLLDADEVLSPGLRDGMSTLSADESKDAYAVQWLYYDEARGAVDHGYNFKYKKVLFRKSKMYWIGLSQIAGGTTGRLARTDLVLEHHAPFVGNPLQRLGTHIRKNKARSRVNARYLTGPIDEIPVYNCSLVDRSLRERRKLMLQRRWPLLALFLLPPYSFLLGYFGRGMSKGGLLGFVDAVNLPILHAMTCWRILVCRLKEGTWVPGAEPGVRRGI
jgi:hypothetical protein